MTGLQHDGICGSPQPAPGLRNSLSGPLRHTEPCAATAWIDPLFLLRRTHRLSRHTLPSGVVAKSMFDAAVLQGMKADDPQATARVQAVRELAQGDFQGFKLGIDGDPKRLKSAAVAGSIL